jgi:hypothetical protein
VTLQPPAYVPGNVLIDPCKQIQVIRSWKTQEHALMAPLHDGDSHVAHLYQVCRTIPAREEIMAVFVRVLECVGNSL